MAVTLTGFKGGVTTTKAEKAGVDALRQAISADKTKAKEVLVALSDDLRNKTGVVRLLHTSDADKDMKFQNSGAFKQAFLSGEKLQRSGEVIHDLLTAAGLPKSKADEFQAYVNARGHSGVKAQVVLQYIDSLRAETGSSPAEALSNFGVDIANKGKLLGKGAFGEAHVVKFQGQEFVYKQPRAESAESLGPMLLADASGQLIVPKPLARASEQDNSPPSFIHVASESIDSIDQDDQQPAMFQKIRDSVHNEYDRKSSNARSSNSSVNQEDLLELAIGQIGRDSTVQSRHPLQRNPPLIVEQESFVEPPSRQAPSVSAPTQKLARKGIANASRVKDLPQVITPTVYVMKETSAQGQVQYHAVAGSWRLKDWARTQSAESQFEVAGLLMPKAVGKNPVEIHLAKPSASDGKEKDPPPPTVNVSRSDLKPMATSALSMLKGLASHGFIHGDIKPENLIWNSGAKTLQLIDNDSLAKVSKKDGEKIAPGLGAHTQTYLNPVAWTQNDGRNAQLGLGRDLFAVGMVLLETSLRAKGKHAEADNFMEGLTFSEQPTVKGRDLMSKRGYNKGVNALRVEKFASNSIEAFARSCIIKSIEHEEARIANNEFTFERYDPKEDQHLLAQLERDLALVR